MSWTCTCYIPSESLSAGHPGIFTKWAHAISNANQIATTITTELVKVFSMFGLPDKLHSAKGTTLRAPSFWETLNSFDAKNVEWQHVIPKETGWSRGSTGHWFRCTFTIRLDWEFYIPCALCLCLWCNHPAQVAIWTHVRRPSLTSKLPSLNAFDVNTYQFQLRSTLLNCKILWRCTSDHWNNSLPDRSLQVGDS